MAIPQDPNQRWSLDFENAERGATPLFGMRPVSDDSLEEGGGGRPDPLAGRDQSPRRDPLPLVGDLDGLVGDPHIDKLADQAVGRGIPVPVDLDVVVGRDGQRFQRANTYG